jgi:hypothetical protein
MNGWTIVESVLRALAAVAPEATRALLGGQTVDEALDEARRAVDDVPVTDDEWAADDAAQDARIRAEGE